MPLSQVQIFFGVFVVCVVLLMVCQQKGKNQHAVQSGCSEGLTSTYLPGLNMTNNKSYVKKSSFEGLEDNNTPVGSLNNLETVATPVSRAASTPSGNGPSMNWVPDNTLPLSLYSNNGQETNARVPDNDDEGISRLMMLKGSDLVRTPNSLGGALLTLADNTVDDGYSHPSRELSW